MGRNKFRDRPRGCPGFHYCSIRATLANVALKDEGWEKGRQYARESGLRWSCGNSAVPANRNTALGDVFGRKRGNSRHAEGNPGFFSLLQGQRRGLQ